MTNYFYAHCDTCNTTVDESVSQRGVGFILETAIEDGDALHQLASHPRYSITDEWYYLPASVLAFIGAHNHHHVTFTSPTHTGIFTCRLGDDDAVKAELFTPKEGNK